MISRVILPLITLIALLTACSESAANNITPAASEGLYSIDDFAEQTITFQQAPERIAALSNGDMDIIYALGGSLVGRPTTSFDLVIEEAEEVEQIGSTHEIDLEKLTYVQPDVVLGHTQMNAKDVPTIQGLGAQIVLTDAQSVDDIKEQVLLFGQMLQKEDEAAQIVETITHKVSEIQSVTHNESVNVLLVYGAPGTYMAALPNSLSGDLLDIAGANNIASDFDRLEAYPQYAQINTERVVEANPDYILIMSHGNSDEVKDGFLKEMEQNAAWSEINAVKNNHIELLPSDLFGTNPGTRVTEALDLLVTLFESASDDS
ncbi:ABC transporter substrate-binding protein [Salipaludibacillus agaradhaerens]|jgi:iron complex transport system substrate-binding protein|uniref:ABC transporter substrate-binding protein n=1 Tax=Salipaludibacillus agaradhaerens TaxID=76935 RepID=A0A9Q4AZU1_SALAG|nr:ABC transporter substrate-binding protein [Salipaludibacillus agaradhaerens]MCR6095693.1 ABC transporter substrate-binding protein [Salipaludibacillus agaradhaerens]MCR6114747.1 ABC transporter substrate-binding protein [Salipaludibacillus agaradhaerens]